MENYPEYNYWKKEKKLENGYFYTTRENIQKNTGLSKYQQREAIKILVDYNLLSIMDKHRNLKRTTWYRIDEKTLVDILKQEENS